MKYYWLIYLLIVGNITAFAQLIKVNSDTWSATDALGRKVCEYQDVGEKTWFFLLGRTFIWVLSYDRYLGVTKTC